MKKITGWAFGIFGYIMLIIMALTGSWLVLNYVTETVGSRPYTAVLIIPVLTLLPLGIIEIGYKIRASENPNREKSSGGYSVWTKNAIFLLLILFFAVNIAYALMHRLTPGMLAVLCAMTGFGIILFGRENIRRMERYRKISRLASANRFTAFRLTSVFKDLMPVHGKACVNDPVCVIAPDGTVTQDEIIRIEKDGKPVKQIEGCDAKIILKNTKEIPECAVISSASQLRDDKHNDVRNPYLKEMIASYRRSFHDTGTTPILLAAICKGNYLVPARVEGETGWQDVTDPNKKVYRYYKVSKNMDLSELILPLFTDWDALKQYTTFMETKESITKVMDFSECVELQEKEYAGIVINPFCKDPFFLTDAFVRHIRDLPVYKERFEEK